jgi:hypothetical protein
VAVHNTKSIAKKGRVIASIESLIAHILAGNTQGLNLLLIFTIRSIPDYPLKNLTTLQEKLDARLSHTAQLCYAKYVKNQIKQQEAKWAGVSGIA